MSPLRRALLSCLAAALPLAPCAAWAEPPASEDADTGDPEAGPKDVLGRPYPNPLVLKEAKARTGVGIGLTAAGGVMLASGLLVGSALAREQITLGSTQANGALAGTLLGGGALLLFTGLPTLSVGVFTQKQLDRTIKGAEKVPRVVANERRYWNAVLGEHVGRTAAIGGGGSMLMGVVSLAAVIATIDTDFYDDRFWIAPAATFGAGAGLIIGGALLERDSRKKQEAIRDEVDPYRKQQGETTVGSLRPAPVPGVPGFAFAPGPDGSMTIAGSWSLRF